MKKLETINGKKPHPLLRFFTKDYEEGKIDRREFLASACALGVTSASAMAFVSLNPSVAEAATPKKGGVIRFSQTVHPITAPYYNDWSQKGNAFRPVLETLVSWTPDGAYEPNLAESWEYSDDGKQLTIKLRKGVKWTNGDEFNADDVMNTIDAWLNAQPKTTMQSRFEGLLEEYDTGEVDDKGKKVMAKKAVAGSFEALDSHTVRLNSRSTDISFIASIADYPSFIVHRSLKQGDNWLDSRIGTGPFTMKDYRVGERALYEARKDYWRDGPYVDGLIYIDIKEDATKEFGAFSEDKIDVNYDTGPDQLDTLSSVSGIQMNEKFTANTGIFRFNISDPRFSNPKVRQAFALAVNNEKVLEIAYKNKGSVAENHHVSPLHPAYASLPVVKKDIAKAKALLAEAGYPNGIEVEAMAVDKPKWESDSVLAIADQLKEAGIHVKVNILPGSAYWEKWDQWPLSFTAWNGRPLGIQIYNLAYRTGAVWNETAYANPEFDAELDKATAEPDVEKRRVHMAKLQKTLQDEGIFIQPLWRGKYNFISKKLRNYELHPANEHDFRKVWLDS